MKSKFFLLIITLLPLCLAAQTDSLSVKSSFWTGTKIHKNGEQISFGDARRIVEDNTAAFKAMKKAEANSGWSIAFQIAGGLGIGYTLASLTNADNSSEVEWWQGAVGLGLTVFAFHFESKTKQNAQEAVNLYNTDLPSTGYRFQPEFEFGLGLHGVGIGMRF